MSNISEIRTYLKSQVSALSSKYTEHKDAFDDENIPSQSIDKTYFIKYQLNGTSSLGQGHGIFSASSEIKLYYRGITNPQDKYDEAMDFAFNLISKVLNPKNFIEPIKTAQLTSGIPEPIYRNNNIITVTISFNFDLIKSFS